MSKTHKAAPARPSLKRNRTRSSARPLLRIWTGIVNTKTRAQAASSEERYLDEMERHTPLAKVAALLALSVREATFLVQMFEDMDESLTGYLEVDDILSYFKLQSIATDFGCACLRAVKTLRKDRLEYHEMLLCLYNFCTLSRSRLTDFAYEMLDDLGMGQVEKDSVLEIVPVLYEKLPQSENGTVRDQIRRVNKELAMIPGGTLTLRDWRRVQKRHPTLLSPLHEFQKRLMAECLGATAWAELAQDRALSFVECNRPGEFVAQILSRAVEQALQFPAQQDEWVEGAPDADQDGMAYKNELQKWVEHKASRSHPLKLVTGKVQDASSMRSGRIESAGSPNDMSFEPFARQERWPKTSGDQDTYSTIAPASLRGRAHSLLLVAAHMKRLSP